MIEAAAGMLDDASPEERIRAEAEEEIGYRLGEVRKMFEAFMSPGAVTEKLHFFVAEYDPSMRIGSGGGLADEGEDIEVLELPIDAGARDDSRTAASSMPRPSCCCNTPRCIFFGEDRGNYQTVMVRRRFSAVSKTHVAPLVPFILRDARRRAP